MKLKYVQTLEGIHPDMLKGGFFVNWPNPPTPETHYQLLKNSYRVVLALDKKSQQVVGFINAISDGVLSAYIPLREGFFISNDEPRFPLSRHRVVCRTCMVFDLKLPCGSETTYK